MTLPAPYTLEAFDPRRASEAQYRDLHAFSETLRQERSPDDPEVPYEAFRANFASIPPFVDVFAWFARDGEKLVAAANGAVLNLDHNRHVAEASVEVLPEHRRRGLGRALFALVVGAIEDSGRTLMILNTNGRVPAGAHALERVGAQAGLPQHVNQLTLADLAPGLLDRWVARAAERADGYEIGVIDGPYPEELFPALVDLMAVNNTMPRGDLEVEDWKTDEDQLRNMNAQHEASGRRRLFVYARHRETGRLDGYTDLGWHPARPTIVSQGGTAVRPEARGLGLGRWLKAENLRRLLAENPEARFVRTVNADVNAAMLSINTEMGFKPYQSAVTWQLPVEKARAYLDGVAAGV